MRPLPRIDSADGAFVRIVDAALAEAARKSGAWLACRPGCTPCCLGPFPITRLDARRLRAGLAELEASDPGRAARVRERASLYVARISRDFPGDPATGVLAEDEAARERFPDWADEEPCPVLDSETGLCDLYAARPITCRAFGPPSNCGPDGVGVCELCFQGASDAEIAACAVELDPDGMESALLEDLERATGERGETLVAFALVK